MRRFALLAVLSLCLQAHAFTLINFGLVHQSQLVWFEAHSPAVGTMGTLSAYNAINTAAAQNLLDVTMLQRVKPTRLAFTRTTVGTGAGTYTFEAFDATASATMCISTAQACNAAVGFVELDCLTSGTATAAGGSDVRLRINGSACTTTPLGNVQLEYQAMVADEGIDFVPTFAPFGLYGLDGGGQFFGLDGFQFDSISCGWSQPGIVSGGTDTMRVQVILKQDAGVVCTCDLPGVCSDPAGSEHSCGCGGVKNLTDLNGLRHGYSIQLSTATNCAVNPANFTCALPLHE